MDRKSPRKAACDHISARGYKGYQDACVTASCIEAIDEPPNKRNQDVENIQEVTRCHINALYIFQKCRYTLKHNY